MYVHMSRNITQIFIYGFKSSVPFLMYGDCPYGVLLMNYEVLLSCSETKPIYNKVFFIKFGHCLSERNSYSLS